MINHNSYEFNEAWLVFKINTVPILTQESSINMLALMDIHSGYIFGMITSEDSVSPSKKEVKQLFLKAWKEKKDWPYSLILEGDNLETKVFNDYAKSNGIATQISSTSELKDVIKEVKEAFTENF